MKEKRERERYRTKVRTPPPSIPAYAPSVIHVHVQHYQLQNFTDSSINTII